jgi:Ca-activated chloride channel family protein
MTFLIGLAAIPLLLTLFWYLLEWKTKAAKRIGDPELVSRLIINFSPVKFLIKFGLALLALCCIIVGAANIQRRGATEIVNRTGVDIMYVLDVSKSMLAEDVKPNRLEKAKELLTRLLGKLSNDRVGLVLFAGRAYLQMPLTIDQGAAKMYIQNAEPDVVPTQGTVIADALTMANNAFSNQDRKYKAIVLVSDGEDHDPDALKVAKHLADDGVMINTVGVGTPEGATIIDPVSRELKKDAEGQIVITKLNETELNQLADAGKGAYLRLDNLDDAEITLSQRLDGIEKRALTDKEFVNYTSYFQWFVGAAALLLLLEFFLSERKLKWA